VGSRASLAVLEERKILSLLGAETLNLGCAAYSLVTIPTILSKFQQSVGISFSII
jgi:hypothetical protein